MADTAHQIETPPHAPTPKVVETSPIRWSETITELAKSMPAAQAALEPLEADATNKHLNRDYASIGAALQACLEAYNANGFSVLQMPTTRNGLVYVTTRILHTSGEWMEFDLALRPENETSQKIGTAITYGRRYSITTVAALAIAEAAPSATEAAAQAKNEGKRLTKAQARDLYEKMQNGLRNQSSAGAVRKWLAAFHDELCTLPLDQEKELRDEANQEIEAHDAAMTPETEGAGF